MLKGKLKQCVTLNVTLVMAFIPLHVYAVTPGLYLGLMGGPVKNGAKTINVPVPNTTFTTPAKPNTNQFVTRVFLGYKSNPYVGGEFGLSYFNVINFNPQFNTGMNYRAGLATGDLVLVGSFPLGPLFDLYAKGGVAITYSGASKVLRNNSSKYQTTARPTWSLGADFTYNQNWVVDVSYNQIMNAGIFGTINYAALGFSYHFVDKFCGQFLCDD